MYIGFVFDISVAVCECRLFSCLVLLVFYGWLNLLISCCDCWVYFVVVLVVGNGSTCLWICVGGWFVWGVTCCCFLAD